MPGYDHLSLGIDAQVRGTEDVRKLNEAMKAGGELALWAAKQTADAMASVAHGYAIATREAASFSAAHPLIIAGIGKLTYEVGAHLSTVDKLTDAYRAFRLAASPTLFTGITLGAGLAVEALVKNAEAVAQLNREISITAARSNQSFQGVLSAQVAGRIEGGDFAEVFSGKGSAEIAKLVEGYKKLSDPVDKAAFAVKNFGDNAERAMPLLRSGLADTVVAADKLAASITKADRESLERFSVRMGQMSDGAHRLAVSLREWWETEPLGKRWFAMMAAHASDKIANIPNNTPGAFAVATPGSKYNPDMPSLTELRASWEKRDAFNRETMMMQLVDSATIRKGDALFAKYDATDDGLQGQLEHLKSRRAKYREQIEGPARGTDLEQSLREGYMRNEKDIASVKAKIEALSDETQATKDLADARERLFQLGKRSDEIYFAAQFGDPRSPLDKYTAAIGKINVDRGEYLRRDDQSELASGIDARFREQKAAAAIVMRRETDDLFEEINKRSAEGVLVWVRALKEQISQTGEDFYRGNPQIFGSGPAAMSFAGFKSPEQALRDARDSERRTLGLYGAQAALGGVPEGLQAFKVEELRRKYADQEYEALMRIARLKDNQQMKDDAAAQLRQKRLDAELEREQALLQMALRQKQEFQNLVVGGLDALLSGNGRGFLKSTGMGLLNQVVGNFAGEAWKEVSKFLPHSDSKYLQGTPFATAAMQQTGTTPGSGGGATPFGYGEWGDPGGAGDDLGSFGLSGSRASLGQQQALSPWARGLGIGGAAAAGAFGIYSGVQGGGARGVLTAAGSGMAAAGAILSMASKALKIAGPIGEVAGLGLGLLTTVLPDPKQVRDAQETARLNAARYSAPTASTYTRDRYGRDFDYDAGGGVRIIVNMPVDAIDSRDFADRAPHLVDMVTTALENQTPRLAAAVRNTVRPR